jgi:hypothetical protein
MNRYEFAFPSSHRSTLRAAALASLLFAAGSSAALEVTPVLIVPKDYKTIPGNACQAYGTGATLLKWFSYALNNNYTGVNTVLCPIVRDNALNTNGTASVSVDIYNPTAGVSFECTLNSYARFGAVVATDTDSTTAYGTATLSLDVDVSESEGYYVLICTMPPVGQYSSKIYSYTYREYIETGAEGGFVSNPQLP